MKEKKDKWQFYKNKMTSMTAAGWEVKEDTQWYTDMVKDDTKFLFNLLLLFTLPIIGHIIYYYLNRKTYRILKPIRQ